MTIEAIEALTKNYAGARAIVSERVNALSTEVQDAQRRKLPGIKSALAEAADAKGKLEAAIEAGRGLFVSPRTITVTGIKVGLKKGRGKVTWADADRVIALIKKFFAPRSTTLITTTEKLKKTGLDTLSAEELKKIGCAIGEAGDHVYVAPADTDLDKLVARMLKEGQGEELEEAA